jgi:hypothetical protein
MSNRRGFSVDGDVDDGAPNPAPVRIHVDGSEVRAALIREGRLRPAGTFTPPPPPRLDAPTLAMLGSPEEQKVIDRAMKHGPETPTDRYLAMKASGER